MATPKGLQERSGGTCHHKDDSASCPLGPLPNVRMSDVGGLEDIAAHLKEAVLLPLVYPNLYDGKFMKPSSGVLLHGPPGTGKTLMLAALANECSSVVGSRKIRIFFKKGADFLCKDVGGPERALKELFEQAYSWWPSVILFDGIDVLAERRDSGPSSVASTLLSLMDPGDGRHRVVVLGTTSRLADVDPALRRPGGFDKEIYFPLPTTKARREILKVHMRGWQYPLPMSDIEHLAEETVGCCGADLKTLCTEAASRALRRVAPDILDTAKKLKLTQRQIQVTWEDFAASVKSTVTASRRRSSGRCGTLGVAEVPTRVPPYLMPLLGSQLDGILRHVSRNVGHRDLRPKPVPYRLPPWLNTEDDVLSECPRVLLTGDRVQLAYLATGLLQGLEHLSTFKMDLGSLSHESKTRDTACAEIMSCAASSAPCVLYAPDVGSWWDLLEASTKKIFVDLWVQTPPDPPVLLVATYTPSKAPFPSQLKDIFRREDTVSVDLPSKEERLDFLSGLLSFADSEWSTLGKASCQRQRRKRLAQDPQEALLGRAKVSCGVHKKRKIVGLNNTVDLYCLFNKSMDFKGVALTEYSMISLGRLDVCRDFEDADGKPSPGRPEPARLQQSGGPQKCIEKLTELLEGRPLQDVLRVYERVRLRMKNDLPPDWITIEKEVTEMLICEVQTGEEFPDPTIKTEDDNVNRYDLTI